MNVVRILLIVLVVALVIGKRLTGRPLDTRRSVLLPGALAVYGVVLVHRAGPLTPTDQVWLAVPDCCLVVRHHYSDRCHGSILTDCSPLPRSPRGPRRLRQPSAAHYRG